MKFHHENTPFFVVLMLGLILALVSGCGGGSGDEGADGTDTAEDSILSRTRGFPPYVISVSDTVRLPRGVLPADTLVAFGPGVSGFAVSDSLWSIDYGWVYLFEEPPLIRTFEEMDSLAAAGRLTDETPIGVAILRVPLPAASREEAEAKAVAARPPHPPRSLQRFLVQRVEFLKQTLPDADSP